MASFVLVRHDMLPLIVTKNKKDLYIGALEVADKGDLSPFVNFMAKSMEESANYVEQLNTEYSETI